jgi:hypothetical protein
MDPDVHDIRQPQQRQNASSPSAIEAIIAAAAAHAGKSDEFNPSSSFLSTSGLNEVLCLSCVVCANISHVRFAGATSRV